MVSRSLGFRKQPMAVNRKRRDDSFGWEGRAGLNSSPEAKKPRLSIMRHSPERLNVNATVSRISRYPKAKPPLPRDVHAPCGNTRFGIHRSRLSHESRPRTRVVEDGEMSPVSTSTTDNSFVRRYEDARRADLLRYMKKEKEKGVMAVVEEDTEPPKEMKSDDFIMEDVLAIDDNQGGKIVEDRNLQPSSSSVVTELNNGNLAVVAAEKQTPKLEQVMHGASREVYKKLLEQVEKRGTPKLEQLRFEIELEERRLDSIRALRPVQKVEEKPIEEVPWDPFIPLSEEDEIEVDRALSANRRKVFVTHESSNIEITGQILQCLRPGAWLNDEVINLYLELLKERERREPKKFLKCHFFNTFFYKKLISGGTSYNYKAVKRWTSERKLGYFLIECDKIFVPIHKEVHWCLAVINKKDKKFQYLDSLKGVDRKVLNALARYYVEEVKDKSKKDVDISNWDIEYVEDLPEQENGFDCGVFMLKYIDFYSRGLGLCFNQEHMPYFRLRTAKEILRLRAD